MGGKGQRAPADPLLPATRRCVARRQPQGTGHTVNPTQGLLAGVELSGQVREARQAWHPAAKARSKPGSYTAAAGRARVRALRAHVARAFACAARPQTRLCLELFAGSAHLTDAIKARGEAALAFDIAYGDEFDILCPYVYRLLRGWMSSGFIKILWMGTPCEGLSRARRGRPGSGMPAPLRSNEHVRGFSDLSPKD